MNLFLGGDDNVDMNSYVADEFHGLVANAQSDELRQVEKQRMAERKAAEDLRRAQRDGGDISAKSVTPSELIRELSIDSTIEKEKQRVKLDAEMDRVNREAEEAVTKNKIKEREDAQGKRTGGKFPPPVLDE